MAKPIMIMRGGFSNRIYAVRRYKDLGPNPDGGHNFVVVGDNKDDVTDQAIGMVIEHITLGRCLLADCPCQYLEFRSRCGKIYPVPVPGAVVEACTLAPRHTGKHDSGAHTWATASTEASSAGAT